MLVLISIGLALAAHAEELGQTPTGDNESGAQTWTYYGELTYSATGPAAPPATDVIYTVGSGESASIHLTPDVHYVDADVYFRCVIYRSAGTPAVLWESCAQTTMTSISEIGEMGTRISYTPDGAQEPPETDVYYKVQTAPQNNQDVTAEQFTLAQSA